MTTPWVIGFAVLWAAVLANVVLMLGLLRRVLPVLEAVEGMSVPAKLNIPGLPLGSAVPEFSAVATDGRMFESQSLAGAPWVALFIAAHCEPCRALVSEVSERVQQLEFPAQIVVVVDDARMAQQLPSAFTVLVETKGEISRLFENLATPHAFAIDRDGHVVGDAVANGVAALEGLAQLADEESAAIVELEGDVAPVA